MIFSINIDFWKPLVHRICLHTSKSERKQMYYKRDSYITVVLCRRSIEICPFSTSHISFWIYKSKVHALKPLQSSSHRVKANFAVDMKVILTLALERGDLLNLAECGDLTKHFKHLLFKSAIFLEIPDTPAASDREKVECHNISLLGQMMYLDSSK